MVLCETRTFYALTISTTAYDLHELTGPELLELGPAIQDLVIHVEASNMTANFNYNIGIQHRFISGAWSTPTPLFLNDITSDGYQISDPFSDRREFGMQTRIVLMANVTAGGAAGQSADLSIAVAVRFFD